MAEYFSHSDNFVNSVSSNVDPRTGMYSCTVTLGHSSENIFRGPKLPLMIGYAPFQSNNFGLGTGWTFNFSSYDTSSGVLTCMNGENYTVGTGNTLNQAKLTSLKLTSGSDWYRLDHGDGTIEILTDYGSNVRVPSKIYSPNGAVFTLNWTHDEQPRIAAIKDNSGARVLTATYSQGDFHLTLWPDSDDNKVVYAGVIQTDQLTSLTATKTDASGTQSWRWKFGLADTLHHGTVINQVTYPMGMIEKVTYTDQGHSYLNGGSQYPLPYVTNFTRTPHGGGPVETFTYDFSVTNFLGGGAMSGAGVHYDPMMDNLYTHATDYPAYTYSSTTTHIMGSHNPVVTTRTYDTFHRLITEVDQYVNNTKKTSVTTYYTKSDGDFDSQPNNYQLPYQVSTTYEAPEADGMQTRQETTLFSYDAQDGVRTMMQTPDGIKTEYTYYPSSGTVGDTPDGFTYRCPKSLGKHKRYVKTITTTYPDVADGADTLSARTELYEVAWDSISLPGGDQPDGPASYAIVPVAIRSSTLEHGETIDNGAKTKLRLLTISYVDSGPHLGRVKTATEQLPKEGGDFHQVAQINMAYTTTGDTFTETISFTGNAAASASATASRSFCVRTGQMTQSINELGVATTRAYDWLGRIQTLTAASDTAYAHVTNCAYTLAKRGTDTVETLSAVVSDSAGRQALIDCDGASRVITVYKGNQEADTGTWPQVARAAYDALGRPTNTTILDYASDSETDAPTSTIQGSLAYDAWTLNNIRQVTNGPWSRDDFDPVMRQGVASWTRDADPTESGRIITEYDDLQTPASITRKTASGEIEGTSSQLHDGRKRLRVHTDESGNVTRASYDDWNRPTALTLADGTSVDVTYDTAFTKALPTGLSINGLAVASRSHDGLGRVLTEAWGKQESTWTYDNAATRPASHAITNGNTVNFTYVNALGQALEKRKVKDGTLTHTFTYYEKDDPDNNPAGLLKTATQTDTASGQETVVTRTYDIWGRITSEQIKLDGEDLGLAATWTYTALGRPLSYTDPTGTKLSFTYDASGRLSSATRGNKRSGTIAIYYTYDSQSGRVTGWTTSRTDVPLATAEVAYDDFGRETYRNITIVGGDTLTITGGTSTKTAGNKYGNNSLVAQTSILINNTAIQTNNYTYDERLRLKKYTCSGTELPTTAGNTPITAIDYTYDPCNNITAVTRKTTGGSDTTTYGYVAEGKDANPFVLATLNGQDVTSDAAGATTAMGKRTFTYDGFGRLASVSENGSTIATYRYDALNRLICQTPAQGHPIYFFYAGDALSLIVRTPDANISQGEVTTWLHAAGGPALELTPDGASVIAADASGTVIGWAPKNATSFNTIAWDPYGAAPANLSAQAPLLGYNGHYRDTATGLQHLGNGYRPYDPATGRFLAPDNESPFGKGGYNPFAYCENDPVNFKDPTGRFKWWKAFLLGALALAAGIGGLYVGGLAIAGAVGWATMSTSAILTASLGSAALLIAGVWCGTGVADMSYETKAADYNTPNSGSGQNGASKSYNTSHTIHKWAGRLELLVVGALLFSAAATAAGAAAAGTTAAAATGAAGAAATAETLAAELSPETGADLSERATNSRQFIEDAGRRQPAPTNQALIGTDQHMVNHGPSLHPMAAGSPSDRVDAFTSDIFHHDSPAQQRQWRDPTRHVAPRLHMGAGGAHRTRHGSTEL